MARPGRRSFQVWLTDRAAAWWDSVERRNYSRTAVLEAITEALIEDESLLPPAVWERARELDRTRHTRQKDR